MADYFLNPEIIQKITALLAAHGAHNNVFVFGSYARGAARRASDLDLCIDAAPVSFAAKATLKTAFEFSDLPFKVDVWWVDDFTPEQLAAIRPDFIPLETLANAAATPTG